MRGLLECMGFPRLHGVSKSDLLSCQLFRALPSFERMLAIGYNRVPMSDLYRHYKPRKLQGPNPLVAQAFAERAANEQKKDEERRKAFEQDREIRKANTRADILANDRLSISEKAELLDECEKW